MPQSLAKIIAHITFSTKNRVPCLSKDVQPELHAYMAGILQELDCKPIQIGGVEDHVHVLCLLSKNHAVCKIVEELKKGSSKWIKPKEPELKGFHWQNGYGAFSVSQSRIAGTIDYIVNQTEHHRRVSFQEEFRQFLKRYDVEYDERYVWD
jgi:REP element-mobilizing transposase RayT